MRSWPGSTPSGWGTMSSKYSCTWRAYARGCGSALVERIEQRVPGERRALDAHRELHDALQCLEIAELHRRVRLDGVAVLVGDAHHPLEAAHQGADLLDRAALDGLAHHAGRALRDAAALPADLDVRDGVAIHLQVDVDLVAAQRVVAHGMR